MDSRPKSAPIGTSSLLKGVSVYNRHSRKVFDKHNISPLAYLESHNGLLSRAIRYVLEDATSLDDIPKALLSFFKSVQSNIDHETQREMVYEKKRRAANRIMIATGIATIMSKLLESLLKDRPKQDIPAYLVNIIEKTMEVVKNPDTLVHQTEKIREDLSTVSTVRNHVKTIGILVIGIGGSGKTTLISVLKGKKNPNPKPSMGFRPETLSFNDHTKVKFFDVGGSSRMRGIWDNYYHDIHSVIFVIDPACSDDTYHESISVAKQTLGHKYIQGKPLLVVSNNKTLEGCKPIESIASDMHLNVVKRGHTKIVGMVIHPQHALNAGEPDPKIEESIEWLLEVTLKNLSDLDERVTEDRRQVKLEREKKQEERVRRVLLSSLCKAFGLKGEEVSDVFDPVEGEDFMAHEIGLAGGNLLPDIAIRTCALVGYQKFAMMIVGSLITNQNKSISKMSWEEVLDFVDSARGELGLLSLKSS